MTHRGRTAVPVVAVVLSLAALPSSASAAPTVFGFTGAEQSYTVPADVTTVQIVAVGAPGGAGYTLGGAVGGAGGEGASVTDDLQVTPGEVLYVEVGGPGQDAITSGPASGGFNGGAGDTPAGAAGGGGGGGASDVRTCSTSATSCGPSGITSLQSRLLVAGGGGGGGSDANVGTGGAGGAGGAVGVSGGDGGAGLSAPPAAGGGGGSVGAGGAAGTGSAVAAPCAAGSSGAAGSLAQGGEGGQSVPAGGGGGGGYYGGGGGGGADDSVGCNASSGGGGAGSSYGVGATITTATTATPSVTITPQYPVLQPAPSTITFGTQAQSTISAPQVVTISDAGLSLLSVTGFSFGGADAGDFLVGSSTCGGAIAAAGTCELTVRFAPQGQGTRSASLELDGNGTSATVTLSGTGGALPQGAPGQSGSGGATGQAGPPGASGPTGATGPRGPAGSAGASAASIRLDTRRVRLTRKGDIRLVLQCPRAIDGSLHLQDTTGLHGSLGRFRYRCHRGSSIHIQLALRRSVLRRVERIHRPARVLVSSTSGPGKTRPVSLGSFELLMPHRHRG